MNIKGLFNLVASISVLLLMAVPAYSGNGRTNVNVSARVIPYVTTDILYQTGVIKVTEQDIRKGYVEVRSATVIRVRTNAAGGYLFSFGYRGGPFSEVWVIEGRRVTVLADMGGLIFRPGKGFRVETRKLSYRFRLSDNARPGTYPWPLMIDVAVN